MWMQQYEDECYDITQAISRIEEELIASFMRNFKRHKAEETELGYNWSAWQVEMMKSLEEYSRENRKKYPKLFRKLNDRIDALIDMAREEGQGDEEARILEAIRRGIHIEKASDSLTGSFFALNDKKIDALKNSVRNDMEKAEYATLRRVDDVYRRTIFDAQVYASTGAGTYEKAVDMAVKDFLSKGIDSVEYKNGTRHSISDYADMAIRTASKRAYFTGEGEKRAQYGEHLVIVNKRGAGDSHSGSSVCGKCAKWAGKVLIDDVWSGGSKADGDYPLMSQAIADGLYHPRCKDSHTTYFDDGFDAEYDKEKQAEEQKRIVEEHNAEEKARYAERQFEKYDRLARYALDDDFRDEYEHRRDSWEKLKNEKFKHVHMKTGGKESHQYVEDLMVQNDTLRSLQAQFGKSNSDEKIKRLYEEAERWEKSLNMYEKTYIRKYTFNEFDANKRPHERFYARVNKALRTGRMTERSLDKRIEYISSGLKKFNLEDDLMLYRRTDDNYMVGKLLGDIYYEPGFISTSITEEGTLKGEYLYIIFAHKGVRGAFVEKLSKFEKQREFLIDKSIQYRILLVKDKVIVMEVIN